MNRNKLAKALAQLIAFRTTEVGLDLGEEITTSTTGQYVDGLHTLLTTERLAKTCKPVYQADFKGWLKLRRDDAIAAVVVKLEGAMQANGLLPLLARSTQLICESLQWVLVTKQPLRRAGLVLTPLQEDVLLTISRVKLSLTAIPAEKVTLFLYEEFTSEPLATLELDQSSATKWHDIELPTLEIGKRYWLLYDENSFALSFVNAKNTMTARTAGGSSGCAGCQQKKEISEFLEVAGITVDAFGNAAIDSGNNFGLNLMVQAEGDTSDRLLRTPSVLLGLYGAQLKVTLLEQIAFTSRINGQADDDTRAALFALYDKNNAFAVANDVNKELDKLMERLIEDANSVVKPEVDQIEADSV